jgi:hypothetical protein
MTALVRVVQMRHRPELAGKRPILTFKPAVKANFTLLELPMSAKGKSRPVAVTPTVGYPEAKAAPLY